MDIESPGHGMAHISNDSWTTLPPNTPEYDDECISDNALCQATGTGQIVARLRGGVDR